VKDKSCAVLLSLYRLEKYHQSQEFRSHLSISKNNLPSTREEKSSQIIDLLTTKVGNRKSGTSVNSRVNAEKLIPCYFGWALKRIINGQWQLASISQTGKSSPQNWTSKWLTGGYTSML
jgi:hypothetical protein